MEETLNLTNKEILEVLINAKEMIIKDKESLMCLAINYSILDKYDIFISSFEIPIIIPEMNREFVNSDPNMERSNIWWTTSDKKSRINAFDKLITCYEEKIKNENI